MILVTSPEIKIKGETLSELPHDLYIQPDALEVYLEASEWQLDLLLYLIRKYNLDVLDIAMAELTKQYMVYVDKLKAINLELAADYLLMSTVLIEIKSRMLLPKPEEIESEDDPRADLVRRLMEYEAIKLTAQRLGAMPLVGAEIHVVAAYYESISAIKPIDVSLNELVDAFRNVIKRAKLVTHHKVGKQELSVREHMSHILRRLKADGMVAFSRLFYVNTEGIPKLVVFFSYFRISQRRFDPHYTTTNFFADLFAG